MPVKIGHPTGFTGMVAEAGTPQSATGVGLIQYALKHRGEEGPDFSKEKKSFSSLYEKFKQLFDRKI